MDLHRLLLPMPISASMRVSPAVFSFCGNLPAGEMVESMPSRANAVRSVAEIVGQVLASTPSDESGEDFDLRGLPHLNYSYGVVKYCATALECREELQEQTLRSLIELCRIGIWQMSMLCQPCCMYCLLCLECLACSTTYLTCVLHYWILHKSSISYYGKYHLTICLTVSDVCFRYSRECYKPPLDHDGAFTMIP